MSIDPDSVSADERHPDVAEISALTEGILAADLVEEVRDHLADCILCADVRDSLTEIRGLLGRLPGPPRMPADIAGRIDAALAAEALLAATTPEDDPDAPGASGALDAVSTPEDLHAPDASGGPEAPEASGSPADGPAPAPPASSAPSASPGRPPAREDRTGPARGSRSGPGRAGRPGGRQRRRPGILVVACTLVLVGFGALFAGLAASGGSEHTADADASGAKQAAGDSSGPPVYTGENLESRVQALLGSSGRDLRGDLPGAEEQAVPDSGDGGQEPEAMSDAPAYGDRTLPSCVLDATQRSSELPLATDEGTYQGRPVGVVVLADRRDEARADVFLVDLSCVSATPEAPGRILLQRTVPRP